MKNYKGLFFVGFSLAFYFILIWLMSIGVINNYLRDTLIMVFINIILVVSLNLTMGFLGQLALGHAGFMAVGAYTSVALIMKLKEAFGADANYIVFNLIFFDLPIHFIWIGIIAGGLMAVFFGIIIGIPTLRLRGDYLAIVTLAFNEIIKSILNVIPFTGGAKGLFGIPKYTTFNISYFVCIICIASIFLLVKSRHGRAIIAIREDEIAAESSGVNIIFYKLFAFCFSAFFAGVGGALFAHYVTFIAPNNFDYNKSIEIAIMTVFGGLSNIYGSIISATVLTVLPQFLVTFQRWRLLIYSVILILFMILKGKGITTKISEYFKYKFHKNKSNISNTES